MLFTKKFWKDATERIVSSAAQGALTGWGMGSVFTSFDEVTTSAAAAGFGALSMGVLTFFKCLIAANVGEVTPSFVSAS
jgi:hypothetical protein